MRVCTDCLRSKPESDFYVLKSGYVQPSCKECKRIDAKAWRAANRAKHRAYSTQWVKSNRDKANKNRKARRNRNPEQTRAHLKLTRAVRAGTIAKPSACQTCKTAVGKRKLHGHHHAGYSDALNVQWLCVRCHLLAHGIQT